MAVSSPTALTPARQREIERWLSRRGLPQLVEGYGTERSIDTRAAIWLIAWLVIQILLIGLTAPVGLEIRLIATSAGLGLLAVALLVQWRLQGRDSRPGWRVSYGDILLFGLYPAICGLLRWGPEGFVDAFLVSLQGILLIVLVVGFGLVWILAWSVTWVASQGVHLLRLVARTLPLVLILVTFLLFSAELWQAASAASGAEVIVVLLLGLVVGLAFLAGRLGADVRELLAPRPWAAIVEDVRGTPAEPLAGEEPPERAEWVPGRLQRANVLLVLVISQLFQATLVGIVVAGLLYAIGLLLVPLETQALWTGAPVNVLIGFHALGEPRALSAELLTVGGLLSSFAGLYFSGFALDDDRYRAEAVSGTLDDVRTSIAVRSVYAAACAAATQTHPENAANAMKRRAESA